MPNVSMMANKAKNFFSAFATQAMRSGQYTRTGVRARAVSRAVTAGATAAKGSLSGLGGSLMSDLGGIRREAMGSMRSMKFHMPGMIGAGVGAAYGGYNDATGRRGPGLMSGALMGAAGGYGYRAATMGSVRAMGSNLMSNARMARTAFGRGYAGSVRQTMSDIRGGARAARKWNAA